MELENDFDIVGLVVDVDAGRESNMNIDHF